MDSDNLILPPFKAKFLDGEKKETRRTLNISFNFEEVQLIKKAQQILNCKLEGTAVKICFETGLNVLLNSLGEKNLIYITNKKRTRLDS